VADFPGAQLLRLGRTAEKSVDLALREQRHRADIRAGGNPPDIVGGVEPDMGGRGGQKDVCAPAQGLNADALFFQITDAVDAFPREQFEAADVDAGQQDDRFAGIDCRDPVRGVSHAEIDLTPRDRPGGISRPGIDIADLGKTLRAEQRLGDMLRGVAEGMPVRNAKGRRFKGSLRGHRWRSAQEAGGAC